MNPDSSSTTQQAAVKCHLLFWGSEPVQVSAVTSLCVREYACSLLIFKPLWISVSQWKSELLSTLGFFPKDQYFPVWTGFRGVGSDAVRPWAFPWWWRCEMDTGNTGCDSGQNMDSFLKQLFVQEDPKPPSCLFFHPGKIWNWNLQPSPTAIMGEELVPAHFRASVLTFAVWGSPCFSPGSCPNLWAICQSETSVSIWGPCLCWARSMSTQGISISIYLCKYTVPSSETCQPHESRMTTLLPWRYWTALHWLWSHNGQSFPVVWGLELFFSFLTFFRLAEEEELLHKCLTRTHGSDEPPGNNTRLGTGVIFVTPSPCCFGLMSIPHSICSGHVWIKQRTCFTPCSVCPNKGRVKQSFQATSAPFTIAFAELGCHLDPSCRNMLGWPLKI